MTVKIHRIRFYNPKPQSINCVSFNKINQLLAVARNDASIEIWDLKHAPYLVKFIPGVENGSIEALCWVHDRLLSTGLGGALVEWDLDKLCVKTTVLLTGYAAWCLDVNSANSLIAVGTEQGYVNVYNVQNDGIAYEKLFDKQEGRILCCKFNDTGNLLVTGSVDSIRVWNVETGHAVTRMSVSRHGQETIVWCLAVLSDNVVVSGDSCGKLTFWDTVLGDQIESYSTHKADILSIAVSEDEKSIFCSGMDPTIMNFVKLNRETNQSTGHQWVKNVQRNIHEHDVRALVVNGTKLVSCGIDGYVTLSSFLPKWVMRIPPMIPAPRSSLSVEKKLLLLRYHNYMEIWKLGSYALNNKGQLIFSNVKTEEIDNKRNANKTQLEKETAVIFNRTKRIGMNRRGLMIKESPVKLVLVNANGGKQIQCCELSPSGEFVVYSTSSKLRMLKLEVDDDSTTVSKLVVTGVSSCDRIAFTEDSRTMVVHSGGSIHVLQVDPDAGATVTQTISTLKYLKTNSVIHLLLSTSESRTYLTAADAKGGVEVFTQSGKKFEHYASVPRYQSVPSAITVDVVRESLFVVYTDQTILEYDLPHKKLIDWPRASMPPEWLSRQSAALDVCVHPRTRGLVFRDDTSLWFMERKVQQDETEEPKAKKIQQTNNINIKLSAIPIKYLAGFHWASKDEAVTLEILPENIVSQLPPAVPSNVKK